jgi:hypothetical protein
MSRLKVCGPGQGKSAFHWKEQIDYDVDYRHRHNQSGAGRTASAKSASAAGSAKQVAVLRQPASGRVSRRSRRCKQLSEQRNTEFQNLTAATAEFGRGRTKRYANGNDLIVQYSATASADDLAIAAFDPHRLPVFVFSSSTAIGIEDNDLDVQGLSQYNERQYKRSSHPNDLPQPGKCWRSDFGSGFTK